MPRIGLGRWLLSWVTKPLVAIRRSFEDILSLVRGVAPGVTQSEAAGAYRAAEKALDLAPTIDTMDRHNPWEIGLMTEDKLNMPRRYLVQFEAQIYYSSSKKTDIELRNMYFNDRLSAAEYEQEFLGSRMGEGEMYGETLKGVRAINVTHYSGLSY